MGQWSDTDRRRLATRINQRMDELGIDTAAEIIRRTGLAPMTWSRIQSGEAAAPRSYRKVDEALGWRRGSCEAILAGGEPAVWAEAASPERNRYIDQATIDELRTLLMDAVRRLDKIERGNGEREAG